MPDLPPLPPDPARLRAILRHVEKQITDNETVGIYLRVQRDTVLEALARAEGSQPEGRAPAPRPGPSEPRTPEGAPRRRQETGYKIEQRRTPDGPEEAEVHLADCRIADRQTHAVTAEMAMLALTHEGLVACQICRPDIELGVDAG
ncbi:DUF6233 domain-containing protein [Streptomyces sp. NPDC093269]|uniref:DUF6233 domain-containing protein n=1 Tax=Streptomyces sp. NPDC093269 TaxID=3366038 RepID=UPI0037F5C743